MSWVSRHMRDICTKPIDLDPPKPEFPLGARVQAPGMRDGFVEAYVRDETDLPMAESLRYAVWFDDGTADEFYASDLIAI